MKQSSKLGSWGVLLLSAVLFGAGVALAVGEATPFFRAAGDHESRWQSLVSGLPAGLSTTSRTLILDDCLWATYSFYGRVANPAERQTVLGNCRSFLSQHAVAFPTDSYGFAVEAAVVAALGDGEAFDTALGRSQATGPYEEWVSEIRVPLAESHLDWLSDPTAAAHRADMAVLVQTQRGVRTIAQRYVVDPGFRERITAIVETLPPEAQKRFLGAVRSAVPKGVSS